MNMTNRSAPLAPLFALLAFVGCGPLEEELPPGGNETGVETQAVTSTCTAPTHARCWKIPPTDTNLGGTATSWNEPHYVLRPNSPSKANLVVALHGHLGSPYSFYNSSPYTTSTTHFLASAVNKGYRVIGLTHRNTPNVRTKCGMNMNCHLPTRRTFITGVFQPGAIEDVEDMNYYDGIEARLIRVLIFLRDTQDTSGGWGSYLSPSNCNGTRNASNPCTIAWNKLIVAGHSQGAGHAAVIGKDHAVDTVVMLSGPSDHFENRLFPGYTSSDGLETPAGGGNYRGLIHTNDEFYTAATTHWSPDRLNVGAYGHTTSTLEDNCGSSPHTCVVGTDLFYSIWEGFWP